MSVNPTTITPGDMFTYSDMANPPRQYVAIATTGSEWLLVRTDTGQRITSDCRQAGWTLHPLLTATTS